MKYKSIREKREIPGKTQEGFHRPKDTRLTMEKIVDVVAKKYKDDLQQTNIKAVTLPSFIADASAYEFFEYTGNKLRLQGLAINKNVVNLTVELKSMVTEVSENDTYLAKGTIFLAEDVIEQIERLRASIDGE